MAKSTQLPTRRPLLDRLDAFTAAHPDVKVSAPWAAGGEWKVTEPGGQPATYPTCMQMMNDLEARYSA